MIFLQDRCKYIQPNFRRDLQNLYKTVLYQCLGLNFNSMGSASERLFLAKGKAMSELRRTHSAGVGGKMYVAVSKEMKENWSILKWAFKNSRGNKVCLIHVHHCFESITIPELARKELKTFREMERESVLDEYNPFTPRSGRHELHVERQFTEGDTIVNSFKEKERKEMSAALNEYLRLSHKYIRRESVHIEIIYIEADSIEKGIVQFVEDYNIGKLVIGAAADMHYSRGATQWSEKAVFVRKTAPSFCHIFFICNGHLIDSRISTSWNNDSTDGLLSRSGSAQEFSAECLSQSSSMFMSGYDSEDSIKDHLYNQLEPGTIKAENSPRAASEKSIGCQKAEKEALGDAICNAEAAERLYNEELRLRKAKEEELAIRNEEIGMMKNLWSKTSDDLHEAMCQKFSLERLVEKLSLSLKETEEKLSLATELMREYKNEHEEFQIQRDNALKEAENLKKQHAEGPSSSQGTHVPVFISLFSYSDLEKATNYFDPHLKIGEGGYGSIYKGFLRHTEVAIKILNPNSRQGPREFDQEVDVLSKLRHPNLVNLVGACPESWALVYEYLPGGSLEDRLICKNNCLPLPWQIRIRIATELCSALIFLHSNRPGCIIHGDLKPANVLLDENCVCKLSDFGICRVASGDKISMDETTFIFTNELKGTIMYMDPEFLSTGELTAKSDVYSFGIILLRLLTGKPAMGIAKEVVNALSKGTLCTMLDTSAGDWPFVQAEQLARLALRCCDVNRKNRPDLGSDVWRVLEPIKASCQSLSILRLASDVQIPNYFVCPIFQEIMEDPHIASDGFTYEAEAIRGWLDSGHDTSPMTNVTLANHNLTPNRALRSAIQEWLQHNRRE